VRAAFNMGIGMVLVVPPHAVTAIRTEVPDAIPIGMVVRGPAGS